MAHKQHLQAAAARFRRNHGYVAFVCRTLIDKMAKYIKATGNHEVKVGYKNNQYYECPNK